MDLDLTRDQKILLSSAREFLKKECPTSLLREMKGDRNGYPPAMWKKMAGLGWPGVMIPEEFGGMGGNFIDLAILLEAMGEVNCPGPFFSTVVLGALPVMNAGTQEQKKEILPKVADGAIIMAYAMNEAGIHYDASFVAMPAKDDGDAYILNGTKLFVENAQIADLILCVARTGGTVGSKEGLTLFMVDGKSKGIHTSMLTTLAFDKQCEVAFDNVRVDKEQILGRPGRAFEIIETLTEQAALAKCAEMVGCAQRAFEQTIAYAKERKQFDKPIGSFQAIQHHMANMIMDMDGARFMTYRAAWEMTRGLPSASMSASMAKAWTGNATHKITLLAHQIHGAIAFCEELDLHLHYRRTKAGSLSFGDEDYHLEKVAGHLGL
jgi:3-oxocholest-4-en-26-oyl-CoA dehydrogenase beta subunit